MPSTLRDRGAGVVRACRSDIFRWEHRKCRRPRRPPHRPHGQTLLAAAGVIGFAFAGSVVLYFATAGLLYFFHNSLSWQQVVHLAP